jgi:hypothetical protein
MAHLGMFGQVIRFVFIIMNAVYVALGLAGIAVGIFALVRSDSLRFVTGDETIGGSALLLIIGVVVVAIGAIGIVGAIFLLRPLLFIYAIIWILVITAEIVCAILGFYFGSTVTAAIIDGYRSRWRIALDDYYASSGTAFTVDSFQRAFRCCGIDNATDWVSTSYFVNSNFTVPPSCNCQSTDPNECDDIQLNFNGTIYEQPNIYNQVLY